MKGKIEDLRFETDRKKKPYAVAIIRGEDIYTWDKGQIETLRGIRSGSEIEYELAEKGDFKFEKFKELAISGEGRASSAKALDPEAKRIYQLTGMKARMKALEIAGRQIDGNGLSHAQVKKETLQLAKDYLDFVKQGAKDLLSLVDED